MPSEVIGKIVWMEKNVKNKDNVLGRWSFDATLMDINTQFYFSFRPHFTPWIPMRIWLQNSKACSANGMQFLLYISLTGIAYHQKRSNEY